MPKPGEHKTVQARIIAYAQEIGWTLVPQEEAERRRGFNPNAANPSEAAKGASLYFNEVLFKKIREFNPKYTGKPESVVGDMNRLRADIQGNRDFLKYLRNKQTFASKEEGREFDLTLIDYDEPKRNVYEITEEFSIHNGRKGNREDVVLLINGMPILVIECKNATKDEAIALGVDQIRRYQDETPEFFGPEMIFTATEAIGFSYGVTWNTIRRNIFNWKHEEVGKLEAKIKTFCEIPHVLGLLGKYVVFAEKDDELQKFILAQHQTAAAAKVLERCVDAEKSRGLIWHSQGSGKTYTMIKSAELLFRHEKADKPTVIILIDRNELEDQMVRNLKSLSLENIEHADRISALVKLLKTDYRGVIVSTIHKFNEMPAGICKRDNVYVLVDEAHRTTGGDLGNYLVAALPNATMIGFTGTPIDKTVHGKGTFKTFGIDDGKKGYLHKYSIRESIEDGTTKELRYSQAPNEMRPATELMEKEFWSLAEAEGVADIEELNKILDRAVNLKNFLKGDSRVDKVAKFVAKHYTENVEPLGYKAFLVAVDRPACAKYKKALDKYLPPEMSEVVYTAAHNDSKELKAHHRSETEEKALRKEFAKLGTLPKILIVTEKLLTGYDAPILYCMYLDKPLRDHTLLQAIARVNRPYENEEQDMKKPHGLVIDFIGIFDKLTKALSFDSDEVNAVIKDLALLKGSFKQQMEKMGPAYTKLIKHNFDDRDVDALIEHFRDKPRRKEFFRQYKELEMLYEIISPDVFMAPYIKEYTTIAAIYETVRRAYSDTIYVDRAFQRKTNSLVQEHIGSSEICDPSGFVLIDANAVDLIKKKKGGDATKVINLIKSIQKKAEEESGDPFLIAMSDRAKAVLERYQDRQIGTADALALLLHEIETDEARKKDQAAKGLDGATFFIYRTLLDAKVPDAEDVSRQIKKAFGEHPNWRRSEAEMRELRKEVTFAIYAKMDDGDGVPKIVDGLFDLLTKAYSIP